MNLDPAAESFQYTPSVGASCAPALGRRSAGRRVGRSKAAVWGLLHVPCAPCPVRPDVRPDVRELITLDEVTDTLELGPNGGLVRAMEELVDNLDWFEDALGDFGDDYLIIDCPGSGPP